MRECYLWLSWRTRRQQQRRRRTVCFEFHQDMVGYRTCWGLISPTGRPDRRVLATALDDLTVFDTFWAYLRTLDITGTVRVRWAALRSSDYGSTTVVADRLLGTVQSLLRIEGAQ